MYLPKRFDAGPALTDPAPLEIGGLSFPGRDPVVMPQPAWRHIRKSDICGASDDVMPQAASHSFAGASAGSSEAPDA